MGVGPPRPKNPIGSEFPPMLRQEAAYIASAMPAASFLASKEIPLIQSDNGRGGPTPAKERSHRPVEICRGSGAVGCSAVNAFATGSYTGSVIHPSVPLKIARRIRPPPTPAALSGRGIGKFITVGFIYRCSAFDVTVSVYSHTQDTAPTRALLVDVTY